MADRSGSAARIGGLGDRFIEAVQLVVLVVCIAFWFIVGLAFWIPLLARTVAVYCAGMVAAAIADTDIPRLKRLLDGAVEFYPKGFRRIFEHHSQRILREPQPGTLAIDWKTVGWEVAWTIVFWTVVLSPLWLHRLPWRA
ncbi:MAG: hypothetical protein KatS3mg081_0133 [Gemmatimonadales bacterium]|nr:MAG: hypothetical protein KatS3mg081_0133 [Gemmatimonadales bacterium]